MQEVFREENISIECNYGDWEYKYANKEDLIWLHRYSNKEAFGLKDIPFIVTTLLQIQEYYKELENSIQINSKVEFIDGRMKGLKGEVFDVDKIDKERPLGIHIDDTNEINNCTYFCNYDEVKLINENEDIFIRVKTILAKQLGLIEDDIYINYRLVDDLGADSLDLIEICVAIEDEFEIKDIPDDETEKIKTVEDIVKYVSKVK